MKKISLILFFIFLSASLAACNSENRNPVTGNEPVEVGTGDLPAITGEIVEIKEGRFLVESIVENESGSYIDAIWFSTSTEELASLEVGQIVSVWTTMIAESYPGQAKSKKIEVKDDHE